MARVLSFKERATTFRAMQSILTDLITANKAFEKYRDDLMDPDVEDGYANIYTAITGMIGDAADMGSKLRALLANYDAAADTGFVYECLCRPYINSAFVKWDIDIDNGSSKGEITSMTNGGSPSGAPFTGYVAGDTVRLQNFNNPDGSGITADGDYTVDAVDGAAQLLTLTAVLTGVDSTNDRSGYIRIIAR